MPAREELKSLARTCKEQADSVADAAAETLDGVADHVTAQHAELQSRFQSQDSQLRDQIRNSLKLHEVMRARHAQTLDALQAHGDWLTEQSDDAGYEDRLSESLEVALQHVNKIEAHRRAAR